MFLATRVYPLTEDPPLLHLGPAGPTSRRPCAKTGFSPGARRGPTFVPVDCRPHALNHMA